MLRGKKTIIVVVRAIDYKRSITPEGDLITIHYANDLHKPASFEDVAKIFNKLQNDEKVLKIIHTPDKSANHEWELKLYKKFDSYHEKLRKTKEYEDYTGEKYIDPKVLVVDLDDLEIIDEDTLVKEARENALKHQQEVFNYISEVVVPQFDFKTPLIALEVFKESAEQIRQFNDGLQAFRNIFSAYESSIQNIIDVSKRISESFNIANSLYTQINTNLSTPLQLHPTTKLIKNEDLPEVIKELRSEMREIKEEIIRYRDLLQPPSQPLLQSGNVEPVNYDKLTKTIYIKGTPIKIDTNARSGNQVDICDLLFKNKTTIKNGISNTDIFKFWGSYEVDMTYVRKNWRVIYHTIIRINNKVVKETFAPDFLICTTYRTKINKFYL